MTSPCGPPRGSPAPSASTPACVFVSGGAAALLRAHGGRRAVVADHLVGRGGDADARAVIGADPHDVERPGGGHPGVAAGARPDGQLPGGLVPGERDLSVGPLLVVVVVALVFVERERGILALVDANLERVAALGGVLNVRTHRDD